MEEAIKTLQNNCNSLECSIQRLEGRIKDSKNNLKTEEEDLIRYNDSIKQCRAAIDVLKTNAV